MGKRIHNFAPFNPIGDALLNLHVHDDPAKIDASAWNALLAQQPSASPFMRHEYLLALHQSGSADAACGWQPQFMTLYDGPSMVAACPLYLKDHSYGEYVFDWAWADAYRRHGLDYYPKFLTAVPFSPIPGCRLLARDASARLQLLKSLLTLARDSGVSSAHLLFIDEADRAAAEAMGCSMRSNVQFHWRNDEQTPYVNFADFLSRLQREKRKKIQQERRRVADAGVHFTSQEGSAIDEASWKYFYRCYTLTYRAHHSAPYLTQDFFSRMAATMPSHWLLFTAWQNGERIAASLIAIDPERRVAYGRYWGATHALSCLHFEACYYQPLAWCIDNGYHRFEGGAQGEHKMARGLLPVQTWSAHWLAHPQFARAVDSFLERESSGIGEYLDALHQRAPFKAPGLVADEDAQPTQVNGP